MSFRATWLLFSAVSVLAACGGGGDDAPPPGQQPQSAPVAVDDAAATVTGQAVTIDVLANDTDPDGASDIDPASVLVAGVTHGTATVNPADGKVTFTPEAGFTGSASFNYAVADRSGNRSQPARVTVTVNAPSNAAPTISNIDNQVVVEDGTTGRLNFTVSDADTNAQNLTVTAQSSNPVLVPGNGLVLGGAGPNRHLTVNPAANQTGTATITVRVSDGTASASDSFVLTVTAVNDAPVISDVPDQAFDEDATADLAFTVGDVETSADALTVSATSDNEALVPASGLTLGGSGADRTLRVQPAAEQSGSATITLTVRDAEGLEATSAFTVTVASVNDAATISDVTDQTIAEDTATGALQFTIGDAETAADALTVAATSSNEALVPAAGLTLGGSGANRTVRAQPAADQSGTTTITLTVTDADGGQSSDSFVLTVTGVNDRPVAQSASVSGDEDKVLSGQLSASDVDSTSLTFKAASAPAHGTVTVEPTGAFTYTPAVNYAGGDSFTFVANDGALDSEPATVSITLADAAEPTLSLTGPAQPTAEDAGKVEFRVTLSRAPDAPVTVRYQTVDGTARAGADYTATTGDLQFAPGGAHEFTVSVPVNDDTFDENDEDFTLSLQVTAGADAVAPGATLVAAAAIADNDTSNLLRIGAAKRSVKPSQKHIDGVAEARLGGAERTQKFNLGGFGINPTQSLPNPADQAGEQLTQPADEAAFTGSRGEEAIHLRTMVMQQPDGEIVMFVMLDAIGAGNIIQQGVKNAIRAAVPALSDANILFGQTHSHAGPDLQGLWGGVPETWIDCDASKADLDGCGADDGWTKGLYQLAAEAAKEAFDTRRAARLTLAQGQNVQFNNYRRPRIDADADADGTLTLLKAVAEDGTPVGSILQYNAHPTAINESTRAVHADYIQGAMDWVEDKVGGVGLYYNGPIADASGSSERANCGAVASDGKYGHVRCRGEGIAEAALQFSERELAPTIVATEREVILPITNPGFLAFGGIGSFNRYYNFMQQVPTEAVFGDEAKNLPQLTPTATTLVSRVTIGGAEGGLEIVTIPGEATNTFGQYIRGLAKTNVMLLGLTHNSFGYIVPEEEFSYVDQEGGDGLVAPFTGYEENVSLGPLTAPMLRTQGYNPLFGAGPERDIPPTLTVCLSNSEAPACIVQVLENRLDKLAADVSVCIEGGLGAEGCPLRTALDMTLGEFASQCRDFGGPEEFCSLFDTVRETGAGDVLPELDIALAHQAALAQTAGCDPLDPSNCLYPFPNDWFTAEAVAGSVQSTERGGTGRRVNISPAATPRNSAGKPVDPTEWNRQDGFSPGALIATFVPNLSLEQTFGLPSHEIGLANLALSQDPASPILVLEVTEGEPARHLVWSELDQNANQLTNLGAPNVGTQPVDGVSDERGHVSRPANDGRAALLIRPAKNFAEGKRYVVVLRNLKDRYGKAIKPQAAFRACLAGGSTLPPVQARCDQLAENVFPVLEDAGIALDESVFMAWDFTVQSTSNAIGRLRHMRDDAFAKLSANPAGEDCTQLTDANWATCAAPQVRIVNVTTEGLKSGIAKKIEGTLKVPSYLVPFEPAPADDGDVSSTIHTMCDNASELEGDCRGDFRDAADLGQGATAPNRLFYNPADGTPTPDPANPVDPLGVRYGDGLPDSNGSMEVRFLCQIPSKATPDTPARASLYGHGQLDRGVAITYEGVPEQARDHNYMFCAVDWFGFRTGDAGNVLASLVDLSNFPVIPDASQQGMLNFMYLARAMQHPRGLGALPDFQDAASGRPLFDRSEIFYDGNSQGGIFGGVVLAASKDVNRGVLGAVGMNYSTLLTRSANFDEYAGVLYGSYTDPLDRQLLFSMMQMLWDRSENDGYASHLIDNSAFGGPSNAVMLAPAFGDPQVTMWSADVMARTMGAVPVDMEQTLHVETLGAEFRGVNGRRHPDVVPYYGLPAMDFGSDAVHGSVLQVWDNDQLKGGYADVPPITNVPPYSTKEKGHDPHDTSQRTDDGRCVHAHFMRTGGTVIDAEALVYGGVSCPAIPHATPTSVPPAEPAPADGLAALVEQFVAAMESAFAQLTEGDVPGALATAFAGTGDLVAGAYADLTQAVGQAAGLALAPPSVEAVNNPPPEPLLAGVAKRAIAVPVGVPLGGYLRPPVGGEYIGDDPAGELTDNIPILPDGCDQAHPETCQPLAPLPDELRTVTSPYATYFPPSRGYYDSLVAKAVALHDGHDYVVFVKLDFIGMLDEVVQAVKQEVKDRTDIDLGDGLIMSATHTHDGPGALANHSTRYFWLAMDAYQPELFERLVPQVADLVVAALENMQPARFGHALGREGDGATTAGRTVNSYRNGHENVVGLRAENDDVRRRLGVLRVDTSDGEPLAVIMNYAAHGIAFDVENLYFSGDVLGAAEREVEQTFATPVVAMLVQNTGGNVSPRADGGPTLQRIERFGKLLAPQVRAIYDGIGSFDTQPDLRAVSQRIVLNRETIGYPDADGKNGDGDYPYPWGAAQCNGAPVAAPPEAPVDCIVAPAPDPQDLADNGVAENGAFVPMDTIMTAAKIGDAMILAQPGEPLTEYGVRLLKAAAEQNLDPAKTYIWGYAQDHIGYLLADDKTDWERGQTEGTTTFWGWKLGDRLLKANVALMQSLRDGTAAPADEFQINYYYRDLYKSVPRPAATPSLLPGAAITQPQDIARFGATTFVFEGGDPVVDLPRVVMVDAATGEPVRRANGEALDTFFEMHLKYRLVSGQHLWTVEFEAPKDWVAGSYRFAVTGQAEQGGTVEYAVESDAFAVAAARNLQASGLACDGGECSVRVGYAPVATNYRLVDAFVSSGDSAPMRTGSVTFTNGTDSVTVAADGSGVFKASIVGTVTVSAIDQWGNTTPATGGPPPPDADGDGVPDATDQCPSEAGPASNNGCPEQTGGEGFPLCEPISGDDYCISDIDEFLPVPIGSAIQGAVDTVYNTLTGGGSEPPPPPPSEGGDYGTGVIGVLAELAADLNGAVAAVLAGDPAALQASVEGAAAHAQENAEQLDPTSPETFIGLDQPADQALVRALSANRDVEPVVMTGAQLEFEVSPSAMGVAKPYPSGAGPYFDKPSQACGELPDDEAPFDTDPFPNNLQDFCYAYFAEGLDGAGPHGDDVWTDPVRNAYNGTMLWPRGWQPGDQPVDGSIHMPVDRLAAFRWNAETQQFEEIPVQVDERKPYFLANANSGFSFYSGTDEEISYAWDTEGWGMTKGQCSKEYDPAGWDTRPAAPDRDTGISGPIPDPIEGIDADDEIVFMASDAGTMGPMTGGYPADWTWVQIVRLNDPLDPAAERVVYLVEREGGSSFRGVKNHYVHYQRDADADQWIDRSFFADHRPADGTDPAPGRLGSSNTGYGPNLSGTVCKPDGSVAQSSDRFPRDGVTVTTGTYRWQASGRWMVRDLRVREEGATTNPEYWQSRPDLVDRWKGRAFQQSPDSTVSLVGFEDEQVNWEANSTLLGERCGPVRCIREVWGADSGTNVTKTETFYRDAITYRYHVRVHPIPPDGLYTSWDYNRGAMVDPVNEGQEGRYFTALRPQGVPIDGRNDDVGQMDGLFGFPAYFDTADFTFNLPLAFDNWEQVSGKDDSGSLVYLFELKGPTSLLTPAVVPYYRDDACLDDGTGDDPVQRPWPGEAYEWDGGRVGRAYDAMAGRALDHSGKTFADCVQRQGAHGAHGVHYFLTSDIDNAAAPKPVNEVDGMQWQFMVPTDRPRNVAEPYANVVRAPLQPVTVWYYASSPEAEPQQPHERGIADVLVDFVAAIVDARDALLATAVTDAIDAVVNGFNTLIAGVVDVLVGNPHASVLAVAQDLVYSPGDAGVDAVDGEGALLSGYFGEGGGRIFAGVGVVDMTPDVGYGAGQYSPESDAAGDTVDPYATAKKQAKSYGVMSRLTARAIVVEGANGKRVALVKSDNYIAQDNLIRRVGQILAERGSTIHYDQILYGVTHAHSTSYSSTLAPGPWVFQDAYDARFFEDQARKLAEAILVAERNMKPARMGATTVRHKLFKGQIMHPGTGDDGTPVGYPDEYGDLGLVVMRFEEACTAADVDCVDGRAIAAWINWGQHPEGLDGHSLHSADFVGFLERFVDRELGAPLVFSQGDVGSAEQEGDRTQRLRDDGTVCGGNNATPGGCPDGEGVWRVFNHKGYVQNERNVRFLADAVVKGWQVIGGERAPDPIATGVRPNNYVPEVQVPMSSAFPVDYRNAWVPGPLSHPYPDVSACRTETTVDGEPGIPNAADCAHEGGFASPTAQIWDLMKEEGVPMPENYDLPSFLSLEENARLKLQVVRLGDVVLGSCACEAQVDLILNFETRANAVEGDQFEGFDWACLAEDRGELPRDPAYAAACERQRGYFDTAEFPQQTVPGLNVLKDDAGLRAHMRAQIHNAADGWDAPEYVPYANAEPIDPAQIKGNFTREELPAERGYKLAVGVGHAGDYNGYTVSYREYMSHDHYRKALTAYGPHTADYMVTRLVRMAGAMKGGPELTLELHNGVSEADEVRQEALAQAHGQATRDAYETFYAALPPDFGPAGALGQPRDTALFSAATFTWRGGATAVDNPTAIVQRCKAGAACADTDVAESPNWEAFAGPAGEVQTRVQWPTRDQLPLVYAGQYEWQWTANFEAYDSFPASLGGTPPGLYRFVVAGCINDGSAPQESLASRFTHFLSGLIPGRTGDDLVGVAPTALACKGGASDYVLASEGFEVFGRTELVNGVTADAAGNLRIALDSRSIPEHYTSSLFPYLNVPAWDADTGGGYERNANGKFCEQCSFRPWATSSAAPVGVTVTVNGGAVAVAGSGTTWTASANLAPGATATIVATYADGRMSRAFAYTRPATVEADGDADGMADGADNCPAMANGGQDDNDGDGQGNACDATPEQANASGSGSGLPLPGGWIGDPEVVGVNLETQCGSVLGEEGCVSDLPLP